MNPENLDLIRRLAEGDITALDELRANAAHEIIAEAHLEGDLATEANNLVNQAKELIDDVEVGAYLDNEPFLTALTEMVNSSPAAAEAIESALEEIGFEIEPLPVNLPFQGVQAVANGAISLLNNTLGGMAEMMGVSFNPLPPVNAQVTGFRVKRIGGGGSAGYSPRSGGGSGSGGGGGGGGGGGNEAKQVKYNAPASSENDIYNKVNSTLDKLADEYTKVDKAKSRMYGDKYRKAAEAELANLSAQNAVLQERVDISEKYLEALKSGQDNDAYGIYLKGESLGKYDLVDNDNNGVIDNYLSAYAAAREAENAAKRAMDDYFRSHGGVFDSEGNTITEATMSEAEQEHFNHLVEKQKQAADYANKITDITNKYQETADKIRDDTEQITENLHQMEDIQIDIFKTATETVEQYKDLKDNAA